MFGEARSLFERYNAALLEARRAGHGPQFDSEYLIEAQQRLEQLAFIVDRVQALAKPSPASRLLALAKYESQLHAVPHLRDAKYADDMRGLRGHLEELAPVIVNDVEMRVLAEAFYYNAWRTLQVLRKLPGLQSVRADGIRGVRNQLLEHPEGKDSGVIENGYSFDNSTGPVIKGVRRADKVNIFPDKGLYNNAREFALSLEDKVSRFLGPARHSVGGKAG